MDATKPPLVRCQNCGSNDVSGWDEPGRWGRPCRGYMCRRCGREWTRTGPRPGREPPPTTPVEDLTYQAGPDLSTRDQPPAAAERPRFRTKPVCSYCGQPGKVTSAPKGKAFRYCKCSVCGRNFKDVAA